PHPAAPTIYPLSLHDALPICLIPSRCTFAIRRDRLIRIPSSPSASSAFPQSKLKLELIPTLRLTQMQDIGGCRGIVRYVSGVNKDRKSTRLNSSHVKISYAVF